MNMTPDEELRKLTQKAKRSQAKADADRAERNALIYELVRPRGPMTQAAICRATDLTREHIARIIKAETDRRTGKPDPPTPGQP